MRRGVEVSSVKKKKATKKSSKKRAFKKSRTSKQKSSDKLVLSSDKEHQIDSYDYLAGKIPITVTVKEVKGEFVPIYSVAVASISHTTELILERIRQELIKKVNLGLVDITDVKKADLIEDRFRKAINLLIEKYFIDQDAQTKGILATYLAHKALGLGRIELVMNDSRLEEVVVNQAAEPVWVFHKKHGWLKTDIILRTEDEIRQYASIVGRKVGRQISVLEPLLDAHLNEGDRVNATLMPISSHGNTITLRKFSRDPWTITKFMQSGTISPEAAALIWMAMQYEMSALIVGGTASGKTSALNVLANFFPPNQRVLSIEDTREIRLPKFLHWVPMNTRLSNAEGKGAILMEDLLVNALRMRPDRILVGEVRRRQESETLFEAIHTGHSCYSTFHANNAVEAVDRLTNPPISIPKTMLHAISLLIVQFRNRRTGLRRTFQIAEILPGAQVNVLMQYDAKKDKLVRVSKSKALYQQLSLYTGFSTAQIEKDLKEKQQVLKYLVDFEIVSVDDVGRIMAEYYLDKDALMNWIRAKKNIIDHIKSR